MDIPSRVSISRRHSINVSGRSPHDWRNIAIARIDRVYSEQTAHACANAFNVSYGPAGVQLHGDYADSEAHSSVVAGAISGRFSARALLGYLFVPKFTGLLSESGFWRLLLGLYSSCMAII